jgi:autotransporter-associated beta strand protein
MKKNNCNSNNLSGAFRARRAGAALATLSLVALLAANARAQTWNGAGADNKWSTVENWDSLPGSGSYIHFAGTIQTNPDYDLTNNLAYSGILFDLGAATFTLGGNPITVVEKIENNSGITQTVNMAVNHGGAGGQLLVRPVSGELIINGVISGAVQVQKQNLTATFSGANTFTGTVFILGAGDGLKINSIRNVGGAPNSLGQPALANSVIQIGAAGQTIPALNYIGSGDTCDRVVNINTAVLANGAMLKQSGTGLLKLTGGVTSTDPAATQRRLYLDGSSTGIGEIAGNIAKAGGGVGIQVQKNGSGTWVLSGTNTTTSGTTINAGKLVGVTGGSSSTSICTVASGATYGVRVLATGEKWTQAALTFNTGTPKAEFDFGADVLPSTTTAPLLTTGNITMTGTPSFIINAGKLPVGDYPLMQATGTLTGTPGTTLTLPPRVAASLITTPGAGGSVVLHVTAGSEGITWAAGTGSWDINSSPNWKDSASADTTYLETSHPGDAVRFDDSPTGAGPFAVTLDAPVTPAGVTVNATKDYAISGTGGIAGTCNLTKQGAGTLTLNTSNTYTGDTLVSAGTLALGSTGSINNSGNLTVAAGATFDVSAIDAYALGSGSGLNVSGTASAPATIKGGSSVDFGTRQVALTITPTAFNGDMEHPALVISQGALVLSGYGISVNNAGGTPLGTGIYSLINVGSSTISVGFASAPVTVTGSGLAADTIASLAVINGNLVLAVVTATTTTLNALSPSTYGDNVTFTATVTPAISDGMVQFYDNAAALGDPVLVSSGMASFDTSALAAGNHLITAAFNGTTDYTPSATVSASTQTVGKKDLTITMQPQTKQYGNRLYCEQDGTAREESWNGSNWVVINTGASWVATGMVNGEILTNAYVNLAAPHGGSATQPVGIYPDGVTTDAGIYTFTGTNGFSNSNYTFTRVPATYTVTPAPLTITATGQSKYFGATLSLGTSAFVATGLLDGQTVTEVTLSASSGPPDGTAAEDPAGTYTITPSAALGGNGFVDSNYAITYVDGALTVLESAYASWKALYFGANAADPAIAGDRVDFESDGIPNILEFALNGDPTRASSEILPQGEAVAGQFQIAFTRPAPADVTYVVEASSDLVWWSDVATLAANASIWSGGAVVTESGTGATRAVTVRDTDTMENAPMRYLRLRISR